jgi:F420-dependent hydroxymycolic acid dehydrogenase
MSAIGQKTKRIRMGTTVTCPTFRYNPAVVAEAFASLSFLTPGRIFLGVGSGEALNEEAATGFWPKWTERSERLVEATDIIRRLWSGRQVDHSGNYYKVNARLYDPPTQAIPLLMAGNGLKAMRRCGQYADGLITDPKTWKEHKTEFQKGASGAGKDPARMPVLLRNMLCLAAGASLTRRRSSGVSVGRPGNPISMFAILKLFRTARKLRFHSKEPRKVGRWGPIRRFM